LVHLLHNVVLEYFLDKSGELADSFVEQGQQLVSLQSEINGELVNRLELQTHACQRGGLHVG